MKIPSIIAGIVIATLMMCLFTGLTLNNSVGSTNSSGGSQQFWLALAQNAWNYFQPGGGVDATTGLSQSGLGADAFTDWDMGLYIQAIITAEQLGLINGTGDWGADYRISKVLDFLESRPLMPDGLPYLFYSAETCQNVGDAQQVATDAGKLFVALKNLETLKPHLQSRIDHIVYNYTNYEPRRVSVDVLLGQMQSGIRKPNIYDYYVTLGFANFWPQRYTREAEGILNFTLSVPAINYSGIMLPKARLACDPLLYCVFDIQNCDARILNLTQQVYLAHEAYYNQTGVFRAFGEASTGLSHVPYVYEWVVMPDGRTWIIQVVEPNDVNNFEVTVTPIVCLKAAVGCLAVYNTTFTQNMVRYLLEQLPTPDEGYIDGVDEAGRVVETSLGVGNSLIMSAAKYGIDKNVTVQITVPTPNHTNSAIPHTDYSTPVTQPKTHPTTTPKTSPSPTTPTPTTSPSTPQTNPNSQAESFNDGSAYLIALSLLAGALIAVASVSAYKRHKQKKTSSLHYSCGKLTLR